MTNRISIIIPVLNEADTIGSLLQYLIENSSAPHISEILIIDGGSTDGTEGVVSNFVTSSDSEKSEELYREVSSKGPDSNSLKKKFYPTDIKLLNAPKGRAKQMNFGAKQASCNVLYFLHADSFPPKHFDDLIISEVENENKAGCFRMQFDSNHWWLCLASWFTQFNWKACRGGDQSLFITKELFDSIGGYDEAYGIYEDNILIQELYKLNQFKVINKKLLTSSRMYKKHGVLKLQYYYFRIYIKRWLGASAEELLVYYKKHVVD